MTPNITLNVTIATPEAAAALLQGLGIQQLNMPPAAINPTILPHEISAAPVPTVSNAAPTAQQANTAAPIPMSQAPYPATAIPAPTYIAPPQQTPPPAMPTTAPNYTYEDLARAAAPLMDVGKINDVLALIQSFGVQALTQLPKEQYGAFATALRGMGARI